MSESTSPTPLTPFSSDKAPAPLGFFAKLLLQSEPTDAKRAITNRLASAGPAAVTATMVGEDLAAFGVRGSKARAVLVEVWREAVTTFLADDEISAAEAQYLSDLRRALGLSDTELREVEEDIVHGRFRSAVADALADDHLSAREREKLDALASAVRLPAQVRDRILREHREQRLTTALQAAIADERLSPQELADLYSLARALDMTLSVDAPTQKALDRFSLLWRIDNGDLPVLSVPIKLQRGETCHAVAQATWLEMRTRTDRINYGGPVASIRIMKGLRYRVGSVRVQRITRDELTEIDRGTVYLTNKRVIFDGAKKNTTLRLSALLSFTPFNDGVVLEKSTGKPPHLLLQGDVELFTAILGAALAVSE